MNDLRICLIMIHAHALIMARLPARQQIHLTSFRVLMRVQVVSASISLCTVGWFLTIVWSSETQTKTVVGAPLICFNNDIQARMNYLIIILL